MKISARQAAFLALVKVEENQAYSNLTLDHILSEYGLSPRDKSFAAKLFYGVIEKRLLLDYNISINSSRSIKEIDTRALIILRMGLYQLYFMEGVPDSAAVNESVELCRPNGLSRVCGFINGILRTSVKKNELCLPDPKKGKNKYYSIKYSCPENIIKLWRKSYGDENTLGMLEALEGRPPLCIRVNTLKTTSRELKESFENCGIKVEYSDKVSDCLLLEGTGAIEQLCQYKQGLFHVQDEASQLCCKILAPCENSIMTDVCSAPGGKSFTAAQLMKNRGSITACDLYRSRLRLVENGAKRLSIDIIKTLEGDSSKLSLDFCADRVLCDVPCSGLGIIRRKPELRYKKDFGFDSLPEIQYSILCRAAELVKSGGLLVYSTCTLNPDENNLNASRFLEEHSNFEAEKIILPKNIKRGIDEKDNELTLFPHINNTDGFFISLFKRK